MNNTGISHSPPQSATQPRSLYNNGNGNDFSFTFPKFGDLPGSFLNNGSIAKTTSPTSPNQRSASTSNTSLPATMRKSSSNSTTSKSPTSINGNAASFGNGGSFKPPTNAFNSNDFCDLNGLFSPLILRNASRSNSADYVSYPSSTVPSTKDAAKQGSISGANGQAHMAYGRHGSSTSITNSPSSSMSHGALDSSCGTTPESSADSPDNRKSSESTLNTINEETKSQNNLGGKKAFCEEWAKACGNTAIPVPPILAESNSALATSNFVKSPAANVDGFSWLAQQNEGHFDPVLYGDYRDPQDNVNAFGDFFNDAFPLQDFASPYNTGDLMTPPPKKDLMEEIEVQKNGGPDQVVPGEQTNNMLGCDKLWFVSSIVRS